METSPYTQENFSPIAPGSKLADVYTRHDWGALPPKKLLPQLTHPVTKVVTTWADVSPCYTVEECKRRVREVQKRDMEKRNMEDIGHNFLIGGDGNIYEGRGWYNVGPVYPSTLAYANDLNGKSVEFAFLDKEAKKPNDIEAKASSDCVAYGLIAKFLQEKIQFFWKLPDEIQYLSSYQPNAPGTTKQGLRFAIDPDPPQTYGVAHGIEPPDDLKKWVPRRDMMSPEELKNVSRN